MGPRVHGARVSPLEALLKKQTQIQVWLNNRDELVTIAWVNIKLLRMDDDMMDILTPAVIKIYRVESHTQKH